MAGRDPEEGREEAAEREEDDSEAGLTGGADAPLAVRAATDADAEAIAAIHLASWRTAYRGFVPDAYLDGLTLDARAADWRARFALPGLAVLLAETAGVLAAFCAHGPSHDADADPSRVWEIYSLHVLPERKRRGIGGRLFRESAARGRVAGRTLLTLWVVDPNHPARAFYERRGMALDGARQSRTIAPGVVLHEVRYRLPLARV